MRTNKFRGLRSYGKGWEYGYLVETEYEMFNGPDTLLVCNQSFIVDDKFQKVEVRPETVGMFITNLYGDTPVFDGDILQMQCEVGGVKPMYVISNDGIDWILKHYGRPDGMNGQQWGRLSILMDLGIVNDFGKLRVIGNIHEQ